MDASALTSAITSLKAMSDLAAAFTGVRDGTVLQGKVFELQRSIIDAQSSVFAASSERMELQERVRQLEAEVTRLKDWEAEKARYELIRVSDQIKTLAYGLPPGMEGDEPEHFLCAACFNEGKKSILQNEIRVPGMARVLVCTPCGAEIYTSGMRSKDQPSGVNRRR